MQTLDDPPHFKIWPYLISFSFFFLKIFPRCYIPIFDGLVLVLTHQHFRKNSSKFPYSRHQSLFVVRGRNDDDILIPHYSSFHQHSISPNLNNIQPRQTTFVLLISTTCALRIGSARDFPPTDPLLIAFEQKTL